MKQNGIQKDHLKESIEVHLHRIIVKNVADYCLDQMKKMFNEIPQYGRGNIELRNKVYKYYSDTMTKFFGSEIDLSEWLEPKWLNKPNPIEQ